MNLHADVYDECGILDNPDCNLAVVNESLSDGFHTYRLEWDKYKIVFLVDGDIVRVDYEFINLATGQEVSYIEPNVTYTRSLIMPNMVGPNLNNAVDYSHEMHIILNTTVKSNCPRDSNDFPGIMEVDYVRYYQRDPFYLKENKATFDSEYISVLNSANCRYCFDLSAEIPLSNYELKIISVDGSVSKEVYLPEGNNTLLRLEDMVSGLYILSFRNIETGFIINHKILL